jgi:hypothetical protein
LALGGATLLHATPAQAHGTLPPATGTIAGYPTYYQDLQTGASWPASYQYQPNFYAKLEEWTRDYFSNTPFSFQGPLHFLLAGVHDDDDPKSMHYYARAADIGEVTMYSQVYGTRFIPLHGRWHVWRNDPTHMEEIRRWYWGGVCLLNKYFRNVLHYRYNAEHETHIHIDNDGSNGTYSNFSTGSRAQVLTVQATCNYIYGLGTSIDGAWGPQTLSHSNTVLSYGGWGGSITSSQGHWHRFLWCGFRAGHGLRY